jgi:hypothetical protein
LAKIELRGKHGKGKFAIVSDEDYEHLSKYKWHVNKGYPERSENIGGGKILHVKMHKEILNQPKGYVADHINGDKLDNRRENLRICTQGENAKNKRLSKVNTSGFKGVSLDKKSGKWSAYVSNKHIGYFDDIETAARAYDYHALLRHGEFALINFPNETPTEPVIIRRKVSSLYRGVSWSSRDEVWRPQISKEGKRYCLGSFSNEHEAALAYNAKSIELFGENAFINYVEEVIYDNERKELPLSE